ncbi:MAG TPA: ribonuclease domain-containing protein [Chitinolyticbacter sp.]|nr:ribonuclease domain-containing protein [Chitinolyticbacter sp.]
MRVLITVLFAMCCSPSFAADCRSVASELASHYRLNDKELTEVLQTLTREQRLPPRFVTKQQARAAGWQPGQDLWRILPGHSIGGDRFGNRERRLPTGDYREADLDYQGGKRNARRLVYQVPGRRYLTVDHYQRFVEIPACR